MRTHGSDQGAVLGHDHRWRRQGKPEREQFIATTDPRMKGHQPLKSCRAEGCRSGRKERGLCTRHHYAWQRAGRPKLDQWLGALPTVVLVNASATCRISYCDLWVHADLPFRSNRRSFDRSSRTAALG